MPLVINALRDEHKDADTDRQTHIYQHVNQSNFKKPGTCQQQAHTSLVLKMHTT